MSTQRTREALALARLLARLAWRRQAFALSALLSACAVAAGVLALLQALDGLGSAAACSAAAAILCAAAAAALGVRS